MIIIDIIKRIHHKTKRKCRRYHEIIINDDQKRSNCEYIIVGVQFNDGENRFFFKYHGHSNCIHPYISKLLLIKLGFHTLFFVVAIIIIITFFLIIIFNNHIILGRFSKLFRCNVNSNRN